MTEDKSPSDTFIDDPAEAGRLFLRYLAVVLGGCAALLVIGLLVQGTDRQWAGFLMVMAFGFGLLGMHDRERLKIDHLRARIDEIAARLDRAERDVAEGGLK